MNNFKKGGFKAGASKFGGRPKFGSERKFGGDKKLGTTGRGHDRGGRKSETSELFSAICSTCQKTCKVPFRPSPDKPVYCSECFTKKDSGNERDYSKPRNFSNDDRRDSRQPRHEHTFGRQEVRHTSPQIDVDALKRQLDTMESKLNRVLEHISILSRTETTETTVASESEVPKKERKPKKEKKVKKVAAKKKVSRK